MMINKIKFSTFVLSGLLCTSLLYGAGESSFYKSGFYTGALLGYSWMNSTIKENVYIPAFNNDTGKGHKSDSGFVGDLILGYRHFFENKLLLGLELGFSLDNNEVNENTYLVGDFYWSETKYKAPFKFTPAIVFGNQFTQKLLGFVKLGVSIARFKGSHELYNGNASEGSESFKATRNGLMAAIGAEYALTDQISTLGIISYQKFSTIRMSFQDPSNGGVPLSANTTSLNPEYVTAKVGVVYRF